MLKFLDGIEEFVFIIWLTTRVYCFAVVSVFLYIHNGKRNNGSSL